MKKLLIVFTGILFISCHEKKRNNGDAPKPEAQIQYYERVYKNEIIYPDVHCKQDNSINYALLLPDDYDTISKFPVIFFIDAHADGLLPVKKYHELANHFEFIFIGSNNSKNGNSLESNSEFINGTIRDAMKRFSINKNRIYVCGFSGGSRVAGYVAQNNPVVSGVIACGAGMALNENLSVKQFIYIGIAGNEDFNYTEMKKTDAALNNTNIPHELLTFDGKHEWCPEGVLEEAITGIEFDAMKKKTIPVRQQLIDEFILKSQTKTAMLEKLQHKYELAYHLRKIIHFLEGLSDVSTFKQKKLSIENSDIYQQETKSKQEAETKEDVLKNQYVQLFSEKDENWWRSEMQTINQRIKSGNNKEEVLIQKRILSYLSLVAFSYSNNAMNQNNMDAAVHYLNLYKIIDPPNSEHSYMLAEAYAEKRDAEKSISCLKDAVKLGFKDVSRLENDAHFSLLKNSPAFNQVSAEIKTSEGK
ncbi:MAG: hypothetical protein ABI855_04365 [Bacteroidota bacterium]